MGRLLGIQKSASLPVTTGVPIGEMERATVAPREKSLVGLVVRVMERFGKKDGRNDKE